MLSYTTIPSKSFWVNGLEIHSFLDLSDKNIDWTTVDSFGEEWAKFNSFNEKEITQIGNDYFDIVNEKILNSNSYVLDVGCGTGRWTKYVSKRAKFVESIDPSQAVVSASNLLRDQKNVRITQASVETIPFADKSFDFVFSLGVLHHIPDTFKAMQTCVDKIKSGGFFLVYLYYKLDNRGVLYKLLFHVSNLARGVISKLPQKPKAFVCDLIAVFIYLPFVFISKIVDKIPFLNKFVDYIPLSYYRKVTFNVIRNDALDRMGTPLEQRFSKVEIEEMLRKTGLINIQFSNSAPYWHAVGQKGKKVLILAPYPKNGAPGQRFRYEQYLSFLTEENISYNYASFLDAKTNILLYKRGQYSQKVLGVLRGFYNRTILLFKLANYDYIFIFREVTPLGPPVLEWIITKILKKKIIYDFDDAIWLPNTSEVNKAIAWVKFHGKVKYICEWAYKVSCGNRYLCDYASKFNNKVVLNPTTIDTENYHNRIKVQHSKEFVIGWTGTHSTLHYLYEIAPVLRNLEGKINFKFLVISNKEPDLMLSSLEFRLWKEESEIKDLLEFNVGLMPLTQDKWAEGKCGFKALQYMALGIPALVSPVGVNKDIIDDGVDGYLCSTPEEWELSIVKLYNNVLLREKMGRSAREKVESKYSVYSNKHNFLNLFS